MGTLRSEKEPEGAGEELEIAGSRRAGEVKQAGQGDWLGKGNWVWSGKETGM